MNRTLFLTSGMTLLLAAHVGCSSNSDCETDTFCVSVDSGQPVCARSCADSDAICRTGYRCAVEDDQGGSARRVCVPF